MNAVVQDVRFAWRTLWRQAVFPIAAIGTLALGLAATTAIFSTVNAVLLRPLPFPEPQDLYALGTAVTDGRPTTGLLSDVEILRLSAPNLSIRQAAGCQPREGTLLRDDGTPRHVRVWGVTAGFFDLFGVPLALGPGFTPAAFVANAPRSAVLAYGAWQDLFGADPTIVGKPIRFMDSTVQIVGVAARDFDTPAGATFWFNTPLDPHGLGHGYQGFVRLAPGSSPDRTRSALGAVMAGLAREYPTSDAGRVYVLRPLADSLVGDLGPILVVVLAATGVLLLLACVNVANLLLARGSARGRELAVRVALGASRRRIVQQLLTEALLLSALGGLLGTAVAYGGVRLLLSAGASTLPRLATVPFDARVWLFALSTLVLSGLLIGLAPALRLIATDLRTLMNESGRATAGSRTTGRWLGALTIAEVALAVALVAGAGWVVQSFQALSQTDPGFVADRRLTFGLLLWGARYQDPAAILAAERAVTDELQSLPGVTGVGMTADFPLKSDRFNSTNLQLDGEPADAAHPKGARQLLVSPGFFDTMGIRLLAGRDFTTADVPTSTPVAIVNRTFVARYLAGRDPLRVRFAQGYPTIDTRSFFSIVGVVEDVRQRSLAEAPDPAFYTVIAQAPTPNVTVAVGTTLADTAPLEQAIRASIHRFDPTLAVDLARATDIVSATTRRQALGMILMVIFGVGAMVLAAVGIYGVMAYAASERRQEMATRLALGASPATIFWLMFREGRRLTGVGALMGLALAGSVGRLVSSRLYAARASDPAILGGAVAIVIALALLSTTIPALRATRLDPSRVLRPD